MIHLHLNRPSQGAFHHAHRAREAGRDGEPAPVYSFCFSMKSERRMAKLSFRSKGSV